MVAAVCGSFRGFCSSKCTGGLRFWNKRNNRSCTFLFGFDLSIQRRRKRLDSLTDLLMKMMTAAMKWHWYLQKCPLYEQTSMTSCIAEVKKSLTSSMIHLQLSRPWWWHVQTLMFYDLPSSVDDMADNQQQWWVDEQKLMSKWPTVSMSSRDWWTDWQGVDDEQRLVEQHRHLIACKKNLTLEDWNPQTLLSRV